MFFFQELDTLSQTQELAHSWDLSLVNVKLEFPALLSKTRYLCKIFQQLLNVALPVGGSMSTVQLNTQQHPKTIPGKQSM